MSEHGGNIYRFAEESGIPEKNVIDFSASINPLGISKSIQLGIQRAVKTLPNYPDPDTKELTQHLSIHYDIEPGSIICGNGSTELIYLIVRALRPANVLITAPTFSEYERACNVSCKSQVAVYKLKKGNNFDINPDEFIAAMANRRNSSFISHNSSLPFDMAFLCNPNNPTGRLVKREDMAKIADAAYELKCYLIVDEAFMDFLPDESIIRTVERNPYLIVLRSMTKFYALSGLRLGYGVFPQGIADLIKKHKEPWAVNSLAQRAGVIALNDTSYREKTFRVIRKEKEFMEKDFRKLGIDHLPTAANYYLIKLDNAKSIIVSLGNKGMLVRDCSNFAGLDESYIRVAVKSHRDNMCLLKELSFLCGA